MSTVLTEYVRHSIVLYSEYDLGGDAIDRIVLHLVEHPCDCLNDASGAGIEWPVRGNIELLQAIRTWTTFVQ